MQPIYCPTAFQDVQGLRSRWKPRLVNHAARHAKETAVFDIVKNAVGLKHMSSANQNDMSLSQIVRVSFDVNCHRRSEHQRSQVRMWIDVKDRVFGTISSQSEDRLHPLERIGVL